MGKSMNEVNIVTNRVNENVVYGELELYTHTQPSSEAARVIDMVLNISQVLMGVLIIILIFKQL